jgi:uncharacterized protein
VAVTATSTPLEGTTSAGTRLAGPDVVRALAMIGVVVMNYHGYLLLQQDGPGATDARHRFFDPATGPLATRFAATFVLVAGVGVTLLTRRSIGDRAAVQRRRMTLLRRGLVLYGFGLLLDEIWDGTILPYYGAMFALAAVLFTLSTRWIITVGIGAAVAGALIAWWRLEQLLAGRDTGWLDDAAEHSPRGLVLDVLVHGTHPLLPWLAFFCAGIVLGRALGTAAWRRVAVGGGAALFTLATIIGSTASGDRADLLRSDPWSRSLVYTASALGTALMAFGVITWLVERHPASRLVRWLGAAGTLSLTLYVLHALLFELLVNQLGWIRPTGLDTALLFAGCFWLVGITAAVMWRRRFGSGPFEWAYRRLGG